MVQGTRDELLGRLAEAVGAVTVAHPTRVAVDGPPAAGKTTLADELAVVLRESRDVWTMTISLGPALSARRVSAEGCYHDTHDNEALNRVLLIAGGRDQHSSVYEPGCRAVPAGHGRPGRRRARLRRRLPPAPGTDRAVGPAHLRVDCTGEDSGSCRDPRAPGVSSGRHRTTLAGALHPLAAALLRYGPPDPVRRLRGAQRRASAAGLGDCPARR